jgi:uncharacterized protein YjbJ (UPF0337 family)
MGRRRPGGTFGRAKRFPAALKGGGRPARCGTAVASSLAALTKEVIMASEDIAAGKVKQLKGKANDIAGAAKGDTAQQLKGKVQKGVGKAQEALGKMGRKNPK